MTTIFTDDFSYSDVEINLEEQSLGYKGRQLVFTTENDREFRLLLSDEQLQGLSAVLLDEGITASQYQFLDYSDSDGGLHVFCEKKLTQEAIARKIYPLVFEKMDLYHFREEEIARMTKKLVSNQKRFTKRDILIQELRTENEQVTALKKELAEVRESVNTLTAERSKWLRKLKRAGVKSD